NFRRPLVMGETIAGAADRAVVGAVSAGICTNTGLACFVDTDCVEPSCTGPGCSQGRCFLPPGGCVKDLGQPCGPNPLDAFDPCGGAACECTGPRHFCAPLRERPGAGTCQVKLSDEDDCQKDADCQQLDPEAVCADAGETFQRAVDPFSAATRGG